MLPYAVKLSESTWPGSEASGSADAQDCKTGRAQEGLNCWRVIPSCQHTVGLGKWNVSVSGF